MAEEVIESKLLEAQKHFNNNNFADALRVLSSCPQEDVKVQHNTTMLNYMLKGGNVKDVLAILESTSAPAVITTQPAPGGADPIEGEFLYDGHDGAHYNRAVVLLHNGFVDKATNILRELAVRQTVEPEIQVRSALLLQIATCPINKKKIRTRADEELISKCFAANIHLLVQNKVLKRMFQLGFCDNSNLHDWFRDGEKTAADRITYFNDLGVLAMNDGKENLAAIYFNNALKEISAIVGDSDAAGASDSASVDLTHQSVYYNAGVCALLRKEYGAAVKSLLLAQPTMKGSPLLWLRISQGALGLYNSYNAAAVTAAYAEGQDCIAADLVKHGRLLPNFQFLQLPSTLAMYGSNTDVASRTVLDTALKAIDNGLGLLIPANTPVALAADQLVLSGNTSLFRVLQSFLCYAAFIELQRMNYAVVAAIATDLLSLGKGGHPLQPEVLITVAIYASEALCHLNKPAAALKLLQSMSAGDFIVSEGIEEQKIRVAAVMINLALVHIANGNWKTAMTLTNNLVSKFNATPAVTAATTSTTSTNTAVGSSPLGIGNNFMHTATTGVVANQTGGSPWLHVGRCATLLQVFIELAQGNRDRALEILSLQPVAAPIA